MYTRCFGTFFGAILDANGFIKKDQAVLITRRTFLLTRTMTLNKGKNSSVCILLIWTVPFGEMKVVKVESIFQQSKTDANELFLHPGWFNGFEDQVIIDMEAR